jgi:peptide/nickel transport system ATP-binding protein
MSSPRSTGSRTIGSGLPPAPVLHVHDLSVSYRTRRRTVEAVSGVSLAVAPGAVTALVGESGSGKSTTAQAAIGLLAPNARITGGSITLGDPAADATASHTDRASRTELVGLPERRWRGLRGPRIGLIPQDPASSLNPVRTVEQSVGEPLQIHGKGLQGRGKWGREALHAKVVELLDRVGLDDPETRARQYPHELSGGMRQRVLIAAALALRPDLLIADEPTSALDVTVQRTVLDLIDELRVSTGAGVLLITHDLAVASDRADELVVLQAGRVREAGPTGDVLAAPSAAYTRSLLADAPSLGRVVQRRRPTGATSFGSAIGDPDVPAPAQSPAGTSDTTATADNVGDAGSAVATPTAPPSAAAPLVTVTDLRQEFPRPGSSTPIVAVDDVSFEIAPGTTHALVGESGSGKTTTGRAIAGFRAPTAGRIEVAGTEVTALKGSAAVRGLRRSVQLVHQNPFGSLDPRQPIGKILEEPLRNFDLGSRAERARTVAHHLDLVSLAPELGDRRPRELSGGQRQRVAIARALILQPDLVVLDEAVSALDVTVQAQILRLLARLQEELGLTYVFISHDLAVVRQIADTVSVLQRGVQVEQGTVESVFEAPQHPYTRQLLEAIPGSVRPHSNHPSTAQKESHA